MAERTNQITAHGRPIFKREDGSIYSEITTTLQTPDGMWITAPSVDENGQTLSNDEVYERIYSKGYPPRDFITGEKIPIFQNLEIAEDYARWRSENAFNKEAVDVGYPGLKQEPLPPAETGKGFLKRKTAPFVEPIVEGTKGFFDYLTNPQEHFGASNFSEGGLMSRPMLPSADNDIATEPPKKGILGDTVLEYAREPFAEAKESFMSAGRIETSDDESQIMKALRPVRRAGDYVGDMTMAALKTGEAGYGVFSGAIGELFGGKDPEDEKRLARDVMAMPEAFIAATGAKSLTQLDDAVDTGVDSIQAAYNRYKRYVEENFDTSGGTAYSFSGMLPPAYEYSTVGGFGFSEVDFRSPVREYLRTIKVPKNGITGAEIISRLEKEPSISNATIPYDTIDKDRKYTPEDFYNNKMDGSIIDTSFDPGSYLGEVSDAYSTHQRQATFKGVSNTGLIGLKPLDTLNPEDGYFFDTLNFARQDKEFKTSSHSSDETIAHVRSTITQATKSYSRPLQIQIQKNVSRNVNPRIPLRSEEEYKRYHTILPEATKTLLLDEIQSDMLRAGTQKPIPITGTENITKAILLGTPDGKNYVGDMISLGPRGDLASELRAFDFTDDKQEFKDFRYLEPYIYIPNSKEFMSKIVDVTVKARELERDGKIGKPFPETEGEIVELRKLIKDQLMPFISPDNISEKLLAAALLEPPTTASKVIEERLLNIVERARSKSQRYEELIEATQNLTTMVPLKNTQELADTGLKMLIARADKQDIDYIVIPSVDQIRNARGMPSEEYLDNKDMFYRLYETNLNKSIDDLKKNFPMVTVHKNVPIPYDKRVAMGYTAPRYTTSGTEVNFKGKGKKIAGASDEGIIIDISKLRTQYNVQSPRFGGQRVEPKKGNPSELGFDTPVYHYTRSNEIEDDILDNRRSRLNIFDAIGVHVGSKEAASKRFKDLQKATGEVEGMTVPMMARLDKPLKNEDGYIMDEDELHDFLNKRLASLKTEYAKYDIFPSEKELIDDLGADLAGEGYTHIPYENFVEDPGNISYIMLTDRGADDKAVLRSQFAEFNPERITEPELGKYQGGLV